jgi:DNA-binding Lrp family transcriptional regulator
MRHKADSIRKDEPGVAPGRRARGSRKERAKAEAGLSAKDEELVHCLERNPEVNLKGIPDTLKKERGLTIPYPTVQRHINDLIEKKVVSRRFSVDWAAAGYLVRYRVGILIDPVALRDGSATGGEYGSQAELATYIAKNLAEDERFKNKLVVDDVFILLGGNVDLAIDFYAKDDKTATQFIIDALRNLPGIRDTVSAKLAYSARYGWLSRNGDE